MDMGCKTLFLILFFLPISVISQSVSKGIKFEKGLTWEQVRIKAKKEDKLIFLDCFTTWCGPCKMMDNQVYQNDSVGDYFNQHFLSVKVQMDKTEKDNEQVKSWYDAAVALAREYHVEGYPTYIFLSSQGVIVHKDIGYKAVKDFIAIAQLATAPGKVYIDPYKAYDQLVDEYMHGIIKYDSLPIMINIASKLNDTSLQYKLLRTHVDYMCSLPPKERYTIENVRFWSSYSLSSKTRLFAFFYKDGELIDKVMNERGYAKRVVDHTIMDEVVIPFLEEEAAHSGIAMTGGYLTDVSGHNLLKTNYSEANWKKLKKMIKQKFKGDYAQRNVLSARVEWYKRHWNHNAYAKYYLQKLDEYPDSAKRGFPDRINEFAWDVFLHVTDKHLIEETTRWMEKALQYDTNHTIDMWMDTYANLLYKAGKNTEAIEWEKKAMNASQGNMADSYRKVIEQMRRGEPTYDAVWGYR